MDTNREGCRLPNVWRASHIDATGPVLLCLWTPESRITNRHALSAFFLSVVYQRQACWWRPMLIGACWCLTMWWLDWCCPDWNSWAVTAGCWTVRKTGILLQWMPLFFLFLFMLANRVLPSGSLLLGGWVQSHGSIGNCQISFDSDWPQLVPPLESWQWKSH